MYRPWVIPVAQMCDPQAALFEDDFVLGGGWGGRQKGKEEKRWKVQDLRLIRDKLPLTHIIDYAHRKQHTFFFF